MLNTDLAKHKQLLARTELAFKGPFAPPAEMLLDDRLLLVSFLLHTADINCPLFACSVAQRVARTLSWEFRQQASAERRAALPVSVLVCDTDEQYAKHEVSFIDFVARPLYTQCVAHTRFCMYAQ